MMNKIDALPLLMDPAFLTKAQGGWYVGFGTDSIRDARSVGLIEGFDISDDLKSVKIILQQFPIVKKGADWVESEHAEVMVDISCGIKHLSYMDGGEKHFVPTKNQNHFSIYIEKPLLNSDHGVYVLLQYEDLYEKHAKRNARSQNG